MLDRRSLFLVKGSEIYIFNYEKGDEDILMDAMMDQVQKQGTSFDYFDAAALSKQLAFMLIAEAKEILKGSP